jgi:class 3 adenylate cyclase
VKYFRKSLEINEQIGNKSGIAFGKQNIGCVYHEQGNYPEALKYHFAALKKNKEINNNRGIAGIYMNIGYTYTGMKKFDEARRYLDDAVSMFKKIRTIEWVDECYLGLSRLDSATGNYKAALGNYKLYVQYRDSLINEENTKKITRQQMQYEFDKKEEAAKAEQEKKDIKQRNIRYSMMGGLAGLTIFLVVAFWQRNRISKEKKKSDELLVRSDNLLLNILPTEVADEIKKEGHSKARTFSMVTVMFTDFKDFTAVSEKVSAELLVAEIDHCFSAFDTIIQKHRVEKIKTVGDAYICVGGMPALTLTHAVDILHAAIEIRDFMLERKREQEAKGGISFELRLGVHTGPVVAGIVGVKKYAYDIWGDTVNIAARMEQHSEAGKINISGSTYELVKGRFACVHRGKIEAKNKGMIDMYFIEA